MKALSLWISVSALSILAADGYVGEEVDMKFLSLINSESGTNQEELFFGHRVFKRQNDQPKCEDLVQRDRCTNGYWQDYINLSYGCRTEEAIWKHDDCVCPLNDCLKLPDIVAHSKQHHGHCNPGCTDECRDFLVEAVKRYGCCAIWYGVWSACNSVELRSEDYLYYNSTSLPDSSALSPSECKEWDQIVYSKVYCNLEYIDAMENVVFNEDVCNSSFVENELKHCIIDENGKYCTQTHRSQRLAENSCLSTTCEPCCNSTLEEVLEAEGCCLNFFNNSDTVWTKNELWQNCGLEPPVCERQQLSNNSVLLITDLNDGFSSTTDFNDSFSTTISSTTLDSADSQSKCEVLMQQERCTNGYWQDYINLSYGCERQQSIDANNHCSCPFNECVKLPGIGEYSSEHNDHCSTSCTDECRDYLVEGVKRFGCCTQYFLSSWPACNDIELRSEHYLYNYTKLPNDTTSSSIDCNEWDQLIYSKVYCNLDYFDAMEEVVRNEDICDDSFIENELKHCIIDEDGKYCTQTFRSAILADESCNSTTCEPHCKSTLKKALEAEGCCLNFYNSSDTVWTKNDLWQNCGLESPGFCEQRRLWSDFAGVMNDVMIYDATTILSANIGFTVMSTLLATVAQLLL